MGLFRAVARPMLSAIFVTSGTQQLTDPGSHVPTARDVTDPLQDAARDVAPQAADTDAEQLVQLNGLAQVVGGLLLAMGKLPRLSALLLAGSLVPTTVAAHRFWEEEDPETRERQQVHFFKNVSLLGGLLIATLDREGRPSLAWRSGHAVDHAQLAADHAAEVTRLKGELAGEKARRKVEETRRRAATVATPDRAEHLRVRKELLKKQLTPDVADAKHLVDAVRSDD